MKQKTTIRDRVAFRKRIFKVTTERALKRLGITNRSWTVEEEARVNKEINIILADWWIDNRKIVNH